MSKMEEIMMFSVYQAGDGTIMLGKGTGCTPLTLRQIRSLGIEVETLINFSQELFDSVYKRNIDCEDFD